MDWGSLINSFVGGSQASGNQPMSQDDLNQAVSQATPEQFGRAVYGAITQVPPEQYQQHITPGAGGTDPIGQLPQAQRSDLASTVLSELGNKGVDLNSVANGAGLGTLDPRKMSPNDIAALLQFAQQNYPKVFGYTAAQYQNQPNILQALLSNPALISTITTLGSQFLSGMMSQQQQNRSTPQTYQ